MADLHTHIAHKPLCQLALPGSHDSATASISSSAKIIKGEAPAITNLLPCVTAPWSRTQGASVYEQLQLGVRYFDLRVMNDDGALHIVHFMKGEKIATTLNEVQMFLAEPGHEQEVVFLDFNHFYNMDAAAHQELIALLQDKFGSKLTPRTLAPTSSLQDLWDARYQVVALYDHNDSIYKDMHMGLWPQSTIKSDWPNVQSFKDLVRKLEENIKQRDPLKLQVLQAVLTPNAWTIIRGSLCCGPRSIEEISEGIAADVYEWLKEKDFRCNIVIADYVEKDAKTLCNIIESNME